MRDLYRRLGVRSDCGSPELWVAINACSHAQLKRDAAEALLKPERRSSYDKLRSTLVDIGILRGRLGLTHTDHWQGAIASGFSPESGAPRSRRTEFLAKIEQINRRAKRRAKLSRLTKAAVLFGVVGFFVWAFNQETNRTHVPSNRRPQTFVEGARGNPERLLETEEICEVQQLLSQEGFYEGAIDGQPGPETLAAITAFYALTQERYAGQSHVQVNAALLSDVRRAISFSAPLFTKRPRNGALLEPPKVQALAPLSIKSPFGQEDYYIKLTRPGSKEAIMGFYMHGGALRKLEVPLGRYELKYATGTHWLNTQCRFGVKETGTYKAETVLSFEQGDDGVRGYSVKLIKQEGGNLETRHIPASEF